MLGDMVSVKTRLVVCFGQLEAPFIIFLEG
jgi:hypothetical protein